MILLPLYFQVARGQDAIHTGLLLIPTGAGAALGMNRSALATRRFGAGLTSLVRWPDPGGGHRPVPVRVVDDIVRIIGAAMVVRGIGVGLAMMPAMTAAFSVLSHDQINDASPRSTSFNGWEAPSARPLSRSSSRTSWHISGPRRSDAVAGAFGQPTRG